MEDVEAEPLLELDSVAQATGVGRRGRRASKAGLLKYRRWLAVAGLLDLALAAAGVFAPDPIGNDSAATALAAGGFDEVVEAFGRSGLDLLVAAVGAARKSAWSNLPCQRLTLRGYTELSIGHLAEEAGSGADPEPQAEPRAYLRLSLLQLAGFGGTLVLAVTKIAIGFASGTPSNRAIWAATVTGIAVVAAYIELRLGRGTLKAHRIVYVPSRTDTVPSAASNSATLGRLLMLFVEDWHYYLVAFLFLVMAALAQIAIPWLTGRAIDAVALGGASLRDNRRFRESIELLTGMAVACGVCSGIRGCLFQLAEARLGIRLRRRVFAAILEHEMAFFDSTETGDITSRLTSDVTKVTDSITLNLNVFLRSFVQAAGVVIFMSTLNWKLTMVTFVSIPIVTVISRVYGNYYQKLSKKVQDSLAEANEVAEQSVGAIKTVRSFANEHGELDRYVEKLTVALRHKQTQARAYSLYAAVITSLPLLVTALVLWYGGTLIIKGEISGGTLVSFAFYQASLSSSINDIGWVFSGMMDALGAAQKVFLYLDHRKNSKTPMPTKTGNRPFPADCTIRFNNVHFHYPSRPNIQVLRGVSFTVYPGEFVALVGESGGGKSTCMELLQRFYDIQGGSLTIGGLHITEIEHNSLHKCMTGVSQEPALFSQTIADNIAYALVDQPTHAEVVAAAKLANCHHFISQLPSGYTTQAGERGTLLSGGQKQRVAIARALVREPRVLLLDEATSALDAESESVVQEALESLRSRKCTVITIAHRLSTIKNASRILLIDNGCVVEEGSHSDLMQLSGGRYRALVLRQTAAEKKNPSQSD